MGNAMCIDVLPDHAVLQARTIEPTIYTGVHEMGIYTSDGIVRLYIKTAWLPISLRPYFIDRIYCSPIDICSHSQHVQCDTNATLTCLTVPKLSMTIGSVPYMPYKWSPSPSS